MRFSPTLYSLRQGGSHQCPMRRLVCTQRDVSCLVGARGTPLRPRVLPGTKRGGALWSPSPLMPPIKLGGTRLRSNAE